MIQKLSGTFAALAVLLAPSAAQAGAQVSKPEQSAQRNHAERLYVLDHGFPASAEVSTAILPVRVPGGPARPQISLGLSPDHGGWPAGQLMATTPSGRKLYVIDSLHHVIVAIDTQTNKVIAKIGYNVGYNLSAIAVTPDGSKAYAIGQSPGYFNAGVIIPIITATSKARQAIMFGVNPVAIVFSPDSRTAYVLDGSQAQLAGTVGRLDTRTGRFVSPSIRVGIMPDAMALTPDGKRLYVVNSQNSKNGLGSVTPIRTATGAKGKQISAGWAPDSIAITPDGKTAYVLDRNGIGDKSQGALTPITIATGKAGKQIAVGFQPNAIAITPNGRMVYVLNSYGATTSRSTVTPIRVAGNVRKRAIPVGVSPFAIVITADGRFAFVANAGSSSVTPIDVATGTARPPISLSGLAPAAMVVTP